MKDITLKNVKGNLGLKDFKEYLEGWGRILSLIYQEQYFVEYSKYRMRFTGEL